MNRTKIIGTIIGILLFCAMIGGLTYAYTIWSSQRTNKQVSSKCFDVFYDKGNDLYGPITPSLDYKGGISTMVKVNIDVKCNIEAKGILYLDTSEETSSNLFREGLLNYQVIRNEVTPVASGSITSSGEIAIDLGKLAMTPKAYTRYYVYVWIDYNKVENSDVNSVYSGSIRTEAIQYSNDYETDTNNTVTAVEYITNLYKKNNPEEIINYQEDGVTEQARYYYSYMDEDDTWGLMNDGLGATITDTNALINGTKGNIRYYGANPNNYVDIGDVYTENTLIGDEIGTFTDYDECVSVEYVGINFCNNYEENGFESFKACSGFDTEEEYVAYIEKNCGHKKGEPVLYRIIGVFKDIELSDGTKKDLIKVIRDESIGGYSWDNKTNGIGSSISDYGSNDWTDSRLMMLLNPGYDKYSTTNPFKDASGDIIYGYEGSLWWNSRGSDPAGVCYAGSGNATKSCNFASTGLSSEAQNKIETVVWNLGGYSASSPYVYSNVMYTAERGTTEWIGKVALMYLSDYGYATDLSECKQHLLYYGNVDNNYACTNNDWLNNGAKQWLLTQESYGGFTAIGLYWDGSVDICLDTSEALGVRPSFYLKSDLGIKSGEGTSDNPYVLG